MNIFLSVHVRLPSRYSRLRAEILRQTPLGGIPFQLCWLVHASLAPFSGPTPRFFGLWVFLVSSLVAGLRDLIFRNVFLLRKGISCPIFLVFSFDIHSVICFGLWPYLSLRLSWIKRIPSRYTRPGQKDSTMFFQLAVHPLRHPRHIAVLWIRGVCVLFLWVITFQYCPCGLEWHVPEVEKVQ